MICAQVKPTLASTAGVAFSLILASVGQAQTVWSGFNMEFTKPLFGLPTEPENQDRITENVWITRGNNGGIFNIRKEAFYDMSTHTAPADTEWATGLMAGNAGKNIAAANWANLDFTTWVSAYGGEGSRTLPSTIVSTNAVVHLISDDIYLDLQFTSWSSGAGAFAYQRATGTITPPTENGDYNENGFVDAADYVVWRKTLGETVTNEGDGADGNRSGTIEPGDYDFWRERFGNVVTAPGFGAALLPEPAAALLLLIAVSVASVRRMR